MSAPHPVSDLAEVTDTLRPRQGELTSYGRNLPHWRLDDAVYFVTWRLSRDAADLGPQERTIVREAVLHSHGDRCQLLAYVVMNDHVHALLRPLGANRLEHIIRNWKTYAAKAVLRGRGQRGPLWQSEYFDRIVRDEQGVHREG